MIDNKTIKYDKYGKLYSDSNNKIDQSLILDDEIKDTIIKKKKFEDEIIEVIDEDT